MNFALIAKAPIARFREHARRRGWEHALLLSSANNTFNRDYHAEDETGQQWPLAHVFTRRGKKIHHFWSSELWFADPEPGQDKRHVDFMWPMWSIFDRTRRVEARRGARASSTRLPDLPVEFREVALDRGQVEP